MKMQNCCRRPSRRAAWLFLLRRRSKVSDRHSEPISPASMAIMAAVVLWAGKMANRGDFGDSRWPEDEIISRT